MKLQGPVITVSFALLAALVAGSWIMGFWDAPPPIPPSTPNLTYHLPPEAPHTQEQPPQLSPGPGTLEALHSAPPPASAPPIPPQPLGLAEQAAQDAADAQQQEIQAQNKAIANNLRILGAAGMQYMLDKGVTQASYDDVVGTGGYILRPITPVAGENYQDFNEVQSTTQISITTPDGRAVTYNL